MGSAPDHELLWLSCAAKRCCSVRTVRPTGRDIWRIATQLQVPPESFLRTVPAGNASEDAIVLDPHAQPVQVALARRAVKGRQAACVFLMYVRDDLARCGLGALRPLPCQAFPAVRSGGMLDVREDHGCTCRAWTTADLDRAAAAVLLAEEADERERDRRLLQRWNAQVMAADAAYTLADYCRYLVDAYGERGAA